MSIILDILMWIAIASIGIMFLLGVIAIIREYIWEKRK